VQLTVNQLVVGSIPAFGAKLSQSMEVVYPSGLISHEIVGSNPTSATNIVGDVAKR
jgi:hypothetical protein